MDNKFDIDHLKKSLNDDIEKVLTYLSVQFKKVGQDFQFGDEFGAPGKSVLLKGKGESKGLWNDYNGSVGGDMITLWCNMKGVVFLDALHEISHYFGIEPPKKALREAEQPRHVEPLQFGGPSGTAFTFLEERGITKEVAEAYECLVSIGHYWGKDKSGQAQFRDAVCFPHRIPVPKKDPMEWPIVMFRYRSYEKDFRVSPGSERYLFGWQGVHRLFPTERVLNLTEGYEDALAMATYGFAGVSLPFGGGEGDKQAWIENEYDRLMMFDGINFWCDRDTAGHRAFEYLAERLGYGFVRKCHGPIGDPNKCLEGGITREQMQQAIDQGTYHTPPTLPEPMSVLGSLLEKMVSIRERRPDEYVYIPLHHNDESTWWSLGHYMLLQGPPYSGKTKLANWMAVHALSQREPVTIFSMEAVLEQTYLELTKQITGKYDPNPREAYLAMAWMQERNCRIYNSKEVFSIDKMFDCMDYSRRAFGCRRFILDNASTTGVDIYDGASMTDFYSKCRWYCISHNASIVIVTHENKSSSKHGQDSKATIADKSLESTLGTAMGPALAGAGWIISRNQKQRIEELKPEKERDMSVFDLPEANVVIQKDRARDQGPSYLAAALRYNKANLRFRPAFKLDYHEPDFIGQAMRDEMNSYSDEVFVEHVANDYGVDLRAYSALG